MNFQACGCGWCTDTPPRRLNKDRPGLSPTSPPGGLPFMYLDAFDVLPPRRLKREGFPPISPPGLLPFGGPAGGLHGRNKPLLNVQARGRDKVSSNIHDFRNIFCFSQRYNTEVGAGMTAVSCGILRQELEFEELSSP